MNKYKDFLRKHKDFLMSAIPFVVILLALFALDDSYQISDLSAQELDKAIAKANKEYQEVKHHGLPMIEQQ
jgi:hypothetical protein